MMMVIIIIIKYERELTTFLKQVEYFSGKANLMLNRAKFIVVAVYMARVEKGHRDYIYLGTYVTNNGSDGEMKLSDELE